MRRRTILAGLTVLALTAAACAGSTGDLAFDTPTAVVSTNDGTTWNITVGQPVVVQEYERDWAIQVDVRMQVAELGTRPLADTWFLAVAMIGGVTGQTYNAFPSELLDPPACPAPRTTFDLGPVPAGYSIDGSVCFFVPVDDARNPATVVALRDLNAADPLARFAADGGSGQPEAAELWVAPAATPYGTRLTVEPGATQDTAWSIAAAPLVEHTEPRDFNAAFDAIPADTVRASVFVSAFDVVDPDSLVSPDVFVLGGASGLALRQPCQPLDPPVDFAAPDLSLDACIVIPAVDLEHPDTRVGLIWAGETFFFGPDNASGNGASVDT